MFKSSRDAPQAKFRDEIAERYRNLSAEADEALARLSETSGVVRSRVAKEVDHLEGARELMSSQVVALSRAPEDQFATMRHDIERVSAEFEQAVARLREMASSEDMRKGARARHLDSRPGETHPHPEPGDLKNH